MSRFERAMRRFDDVFAFAMLHVPVFAVALLAALVWEPMWTVVVIVALSMAFWGVVLAVLLEMAVRAKRSEHHR